MIVLNIKAIAYRIPRLFEIRKFSNTSSRACHCSLHWAQTNPSHFLISDTRRHNQLRHLPSNAQTFSPTPCKTVNLLLFNLMIVFKFGIFELPETVSLHTEIYIILLPFLHSSKLLRSVALHRWLPGSAPFLSHSSELWLWKCYNVTINNHRPLMVNRQSSWFHRLTDVILPCQACSNKILLNVTKT